MSGTVSVQRVWSLEAGLSRIEKKVEAHALELRKEIRASAEETRAAIGEDMRIAFDALRQELIAAIDAGLRDSELNVTDRDDGLVEVVSTTRVARPTIDRPVVEIFGRTR